MSDIKSKKQALEGEINEVIRKRVYGNGVSEMTDELRKKMIEIISACKDMVITTIREDGWPQANTVGFVNIGPDIYIETFKTSSKARNIARDPRVSVAISPFYDNVMDGCGISMAGYAEEVPGEEMAKEVERRLLEKMPELADITYNDGDKVFPDPNTTRFRIRPTVISILDFSKGFGHADLVAVADDSQTE